VALVVTLVMLALITVMAVAFLALARRETAAVDTLGSTTDAEIMAETALERAKAQILAHIVAVRNNVVTNPPGPDLMVSLAGGNPVLANPYDDTNDLTADQPNIGLWASQQIDPSPPVFASVLQGNTRRIEDRRYLDLDRNGYADETGLVPFTDDALDPGTGRYRPLLDAAGAQVPNFVVGDPHWIGVPRLPAQPHGRNNRFLGRYAFLVVPAGRALDVNWIHNQGISGLNMASGQNGYFRNQGVGSWELNLAAFLCDLNTNVWNAPSPWGSANAYAYDETGGPSTGTAFDAARELLMHRYAPPGWRAGIDPSPHTLLDSATALMPAANTAFEFDFIDAYANGPLSVLGASISADGNDLPTQPWPGSDSRKHNFSLHEFFNPLVPPAPAFANGLTAASARGNSYDRYTFYRMLAQLGTDSVPEPENDKVNINYCNLPPFRASELKPWNHPDVEAYFGRRGSEVFFTNVVHRLLSKEFRLNLAGGPGIPIFLNGSRASTNGPLYSSRIHQILQLAANIYDATFESKYGEAFPYYPTVFSPRFTSLNGGEEIFITDYKEETAASFLSRPWRDLDNPTDRSLLQTSNNVFGVPLIIGARKGFPNFNEFAIQSQAKVIRRLQFTKNAATDPKPATTNQQFILSISNLFGMEAWYPYGASNGSPYPRNLTVLFTNIISSVVTNTFGFSYLLSDGIGYSTNVNTPTWTGGSFADLPITPQIAMPPSIYEAAGNRVLGASNNPTFYENAAGVLQPGWELKVRNRPQFFIFDNGRLVDAVALADTDTLLPISTELVRQSGASPVQELKDLWRTNQAGAVSRGIQAQMDISRSRSIANSVSSGQWGAWDYSSSYTDKEKAVDGFSAFLGDPGATVTNTVTTMQAPFTAVMSLHQYTAWQVDDPLVHYRSADLWSTTNDSQVSLKQTKNLQKELSLPNSRYAAWNGRPDFGGRTGSSTDGSANDIGTWDSAVQRPDDWNFPTHKFPNAGWLGRVHRGTPWQTINLKPETASSAGNWRRKTGAGYSLQTLPTNDWRLLDIFTTAIHPNATRGRLSINQTNLAAWSAVLSGVSVSKAVTDADGNASATDVVVEPAAFDFPVSLLVSNINALRAAQPGGVFRNLGDILAVPALSTETPFLKEPIVDPDTFGLMGDLKFNRLRDEDYERIPQQILGLLKVGEPRYVVYAWGQSLKPAGNVPGLGLGIDPSTQVVRNYQVTGETATRAVVRVDYDRAGRPHAVVESFNIIPLE
jgi:hypothetical protein